MKRITEINICNYRAFYNEVGEDNKYNIKLKNGENLLIYGENGSGKSSLFKALKDFFLSAEDAGLQPNENIFSQVGFPDTEVKVSLSEKQANGSFVLLETIIFNNEAPTTIDNEHLLNSLNAFLTYRDILYTYLPENIDGKNPNLFVLFFEVILSRITDDESNNDIRSEIGDLMEKIKTLEDAFEQIRKEIDEYDPGKTKEETMGIDQIKKDLIDDIDGRISGLNCRFIELLNGLLNDVNNYLSHYFMVNIEVSISNSYEFLSKEGIFPKFNLKKQLCLDVKYFDSVIDTQDYPSFLNEARLSAIAICLYFAAVKKEERRKRDNYKFLFLDDIFIGIDTANRIPLLKILANDFNDFQIVISTYDREWFEFAKHWVELKVPPKWEFYELYNNDYSYSNKEVPKLLTNKDHLSQALYYYKQFDYSASGNYLRKACEETLRKILPSICLKTNDGLNLSKLSNMLDNATSFFKIMGNPIDELTSLSVYLKSLMNPLSHYDASVTVFKQEIKDIDVALNKLLTYDFSKTKLKKVFEKGALLKLTYEVKTNIYNVYEIKIKDDFWIYKHGTDPVIYMGFVDCENLTLYEVNNGVKGEGYYHPIEKKSLKQFYEDVVQFENTKTPSPNITIRSDYEILYEYRVEKGGWEKLTDLIVL